MKSNRHRKGKTILKQKNKVGYYYYLILRLTLKLQQVIIIGHWCYRHRGQQTRIGFRNRSRHKWPNDFFFFTVFIFCWKKRGICETLGLSDSLYDSATFVLTKMTLWFKEKEYSFQRIVLKQLDYHVTEKKESKPTSLLSPHTQKLTLNKSQT